MVEATINFLQGLAISIPVVPFSFIASLIEEVVSPIPSPLVMGTVGSILSARDVVPWYIFAGVLLAATVGKVLGYWGIYTVADKLEDLFMKTFGKKIGVSHEQIESIGKLFSGTKRDDWFIFIVRFLPVLPSAPITITAGVIKLPLKGFLIASFFGTGLRNVMYLSIGYVAWGSIRDFFLGIEQHGGWIQIGVLVFLGTIILWAVRQRGKGKFVDRLAKIFKDKPKEIQ